MKSQLERLGLPAFCFVISMGVILAIASTLSSPNALADDPPAEGTGQESNDEADSGPRVDYQAQITAGGEAELTDILTRTSQLILLADRPPATLAALERRAEADLARLETALRSEGFYAGSVTFEIDEDSRPILIDVSVDPGPVYLLTDFDIDFGSGAAPGLPRDLTALGIELGRPARAPAILRAERKLLRDLANSGHPLAEKTARRALVNHGESSLRVELEIDPGPPATFGPLTVDGLTSVDEDYVRELIPWEEGARFDRRELDKARIALSQTNLFSSITLKEGEAVNERGGLPVALALLERDHRTVGATISYSTSEGPGLEVFWQHRNLLGGNENLGFSAEGSLIEQNVSLDLRKPRFWREDQTLLANTSLIRRDNEAFQEESANAFIGLERKLNEIWRGSAGASLAYEIIEDDEEGERNFTLFGLPITADRDTSDDLLNPSEGSRLRLATTPSLGTGDDDIAFLTNQVTASAYYALDEEKQFILAGRARLGSIVGTDTQTLPANRRFYAGGAGSVRGYEFQRLGPLDDDDDPVGGRSVLEFSAEVRARVYEDFGIVPFVEGGIVGDDPLVTFDEDFLWAVGLGLRYYTAVGPLRLDVAFPINPRDDDDFFQFYVSLGQAF